MAKSENFGNAIKTCSYKKPERCGKVLVKGVNWGGGTKYICWDCDRIRNCLLYTSPSPRDGLLSRMPSSA